MPLLHPFYHELKQLLKLMLPILITQVAQAGFGLVDTIMAGQISADELAAIAVGVGIWMPVMLLCSGILLATSPLIAEAVGAKKIAQVPVITHQSLWIAIIIGCIGMLILQFAPLCFSLIKVPENLHAKASLFLHSIALGIPAVALYTTLRAYSEALGRPQVVTVISLLALPCLIPLNALFMHGGFGLPAFGGAGAGIANAILQWLMLIVLAIYLKYAKAFEHTRLFTHFHAFDVQLSKDIFKLGLPIGLSIFFEVSLFSTAALVVSPLGDKIIAAHQIAMSVTSQLFMIPMALSIALTIRVGRYYGSQNWLAMRHAQVMGFVAATLFAIINMIFLWFFREQIIHAYNHDAEVFHIAFGLLLFALAYQLCDAWQVTAASCLRGMQDTKKPMWITLISYWLVAFPVGVYCTRYADFSAAGVWIGLITGLIIACVLLLLRLVRMNYKISRKHSASQ